MRVRLILIAVVSLLLTLLIPAAAEASSGDNWWQNHCPSGFDGPDKDGNCSKTTTETFDADKIVHYHCPAGYTGPDKANQCTRFDVETFPADPVYDYRCPPGWEGPTSGAECSRPTTTVEIVHVTEVITPICPDGWSTDSNGDCAFTYPALEPVPVAVADNVSCPEPVDIAGELFEFVLADDLSECVAAGQSPSVTDAIAVSTYRCPVPYTLIIDNTCGRDEVVPELAGKVQGPLAVDCAPETPFDPVVGTCATTVPAKTVYSCPFGLELDARQFPPVCEFKGRVDPAIPTLTCPAPLTNLQVSLPSGEGTCTLSTSPFDIISYVCPDGFTQVVGPQFEQVCSRDQIVTTIINSVEFVELSCDFGGGPVYSGPDINGRCTAFNPVVVVELPIFTAEYFCGPGALGPDANNECFTVATATITTPPVDLPTFSCPSEYVGPDADWNCTRTVGGTEVIDAEKFISSYTCPADSRGPNRDQVCSRDLIDIVDADEKITYSCPDDAHGAKDGTCTRRTTEYVKAGNQQCRQRYHHRWGHWSTCNP